MLLLTSTFVYVYHFWFFSRGEIPMRKYETLELEIKYLDVEDVITTSPINLGTDTPFIDIDGSLLS